MKRIIQVIYPFLIACYPILALRNFNITYVDIASIMRTLFTAILLTAVFWLTSFLFFRSWTKAGIAASLAVIVIFSYGHVHIQSATLFGNPIRHSYLSLLFIILYLLTIWLATRTGTSSETTRNFLAVTSLALFVMSVGQSFYYDYGTYRATKVLASQQDQNTEVSTGSSNLPDIYLIVLDAHTRQDVLKDEYGLDNSFFLQGLKDLGFYVADCSQSNYASTNLSLSSLFSTNYIPTDLSETAKLPPFKETTVRKTLDSLGYTIITYENRSSGHFDLQEDIRLSQNQLVFGELNLTGGINEFEEMMLQTSIAKLFWDTELLPGFNENTLVRLENYDHYKQTLFTLSSLKDVPKMRSPKFVFVHILVPHGPYVFTADGKFKKLEDHSKNGYRDNTEFIDRSLLPSLQTIIAESEKPPVIIVMGDHGPPPGKNASAADRMKNLNAYFVNQETAADLYPTITPVNSFRVIFNHYFGENYPLLEDASYHAYKLKQLGKVDIMENTCAPAE